MKKFIKKIIFSNEYLLFLYKYLITLKNRIAYNNNKFAEYYIKKTYLKKNRKKINFQNKLETFTEKIQYRKLYPDNPLFTICADKYLVREYIKEKIGEEYLIPLYLVTEKLNFEQWEKLPNSFVVKPNHDSGNFEIVQDKKNLSKTTIKKIITKMNLALKINFGWLMLEKHYIDIKPRIIIEKLLLTKKNKLPTDYKFYCFKNKILVQIIERDIKTHEIKMKFLDENWESLGIKREKSEIKDLIKPKNFEKMVELARKLSEDFNYVRVDFYNIDGKIYFGELTFTPASGFMTFNPDIWDKKLGEYWTNE